MGAAAAADAFRPDGECAVLELVGRYEVQERIGEGAMADVYRAYDPGINRVLAIKVLKGEFRSNAHYAARFLREAKAAGALSHPNIVTIYDVGEVDGYPYIVMELLEGESLDVVARREGPLPSDRVMEIGLQLAEALRYAHGLGVIHRDIKPSNVILGRDGRTVKLVDFGIARVAEADPARSEADSIKTQVGQVVGTPRYMSPEQALGQALDGRSDLFSTGVVLYELITGRKAFAGASPATLALQITQSEPEPIAAIESGCPRGLQFIVGKLLAKRRDRRFADGGQLADALRRELSVYQTVMAEAHGRRRYLSLQARMTLAMAATTAVVLLACTGGVLDRQYDAMRNMTLTSGANIANFVANNAALRAVDNAALPPQERDWLPVQAFITAATADRNIKEMTVVDADGLVRASTHAGLVGWSYHPPRGERPVRAGPVLTVTRTPDGGGFRFVRPINYAGRAFGKVDVTVSTAELRSAARLSLLLMSLMAAVTIGVVIAVTYTAVRLLAQPIRRLKSALADAARGQGDFRISHSRKDEFGDLFDAFNLYAAAMQERLEAAEAMMRLTNDAPSNFGQRRAPAAGPFAGPDETEAALEQTRIATLGGSPADVERTVVGAVPGRAS
jgi:serine/threonine-protein kinase